MNIESKLTIYSSLMSNDSFIRSRFVDDKRVWENIPFSRIVSPHLCMPLGLAKELSKIEEDNITMEVYKSSSCGRSESEIVTAWENLWNRTKRDQEGFNLYMEDLKSKYPDWRVK